MAPELTRWCPRSVTYHVGVAYASRHDHRVNRRIFLAQIEPLPHHIPEELYHSSPFPEGSQAATYTPLIAADSQPQSADHGADFLQPSAAAPTAAPVWQRQSSFQRGSAASDDEYSQHDDLFGSEASFSDDAAVADPSDANNPAVSQPSHFASPTAAAPLAAVAAAFCSSPSSLAEPGREGAQQVLQASPQGIAALGGVMGASMWHKSLREDTLGVQPAALPLQGASACSSPIRQSSPVSSQQQQHKATPCARSSQQKARSSRSTGAALACAADSESSVLVSKDLLLRYYQLEAFAAEYYTWFISQNAADSESASRNTEPDIVL